MDESGPLPAGHRSRRWVRRVAAGLLGAAVLAATVGGLAWTWRVEMLNRFFDSEGALWRIHVESARWENGRLRIEGLRISHADQAEPVVAAVAASVSGDWNQLREGRLGAVEVESPVVHWRAGLRSAAEPDPPSAGNGPLVSWDSVKVVDGTIDAADPDLFSFTGRLRAQGGTGFWTRDGRLHLSPQTLEITGPVYAMTVAAGGPAKLEVRAPLLTLSGELNAENGFLLLKDAAMAAARAKWVRSETAAVSAEGAPAEAAGRSGVTPLIRQVRLEGLKAADFEIGARLPWELGGRGDIALGVLTAGPEVPFSFEGLEVSGAVLTLPEKASVPGLALSGRWQEDGAVLDSLTFSGAGVPDLPGLLRAIGMEPPAGLAGRFTADAELRRVGWKDGRLESSATQSLTLRKPELAVSGLPRARAEQLILEAVPDELKEHRRFRRVELTAPDLAIVPEPATAGPGADGEPDPSGRPVWEGWTADLLTVTDGRVAVTLPTAGGAEITSGLQVSTDPADGVDSSPFYRIALREPQLIHPQFAAQPVALATAIQLTASAAGLWQKREVDSLTLAGTRLQIGEALFRLMKSMPAAEAEPPATSQTPRQKSPPWRLRSVVLEDSLIQLDHLGDGRRLEIPVKRQEFHDLPLDASALAAVDRLYKIEVPNITLYNPFSAGQKVAVLDTNFIQFTPSGLLERRLERVDLMLPSLFAGQPLFEFVKAARKRFAELAAAPAPSPGSGPLLVDTDRKSPATLSAIASVTPHAAAAAAADWHIPFYTESGKVVVAPKGFPWPNLPVIPFRNARDASGQPIPFLLQGESFHGELAIEPGWYDFPEYKVRLRLSDRGRIVFNTPQKEKDNNLTEVFENNTLIFRQLRLDGVWLSITYDERGIYAKFGGETCGGSLTGGVNLYLDELYTWDAWVSMVDVQMQPLTARLTPETFSMSGPVDELTLKAYGDTTTLYQATVELKVSRPGTLHLLALDSLKERIGALEGISADLGKIGIGSLRDFAYTGCTGGLKLFGTEGDGQLVLTGPAGSRTFNLRLHDYRASAPKTAAPF